MIRLKYNNEIKKKKNLRYQTEIMLNDFFFKSPNPPPTPTRDFTLLSIHELQLLDSHQCSKSLLLKLSSLQYDQKNYLLKSRNRLNSILNRNSHTQKQFRLEDKLAKKCKTIGHSLQAKEQSMLNEPKRVKLVPLNKQMQKKFVKKKVRFNTQTNQTKLLKKSKKKSNFPFEVKGRYQQNILQKNKYIMSLTRKSEKEDLFKQSSRTKRPSPWCITEKVFDETEQFQPLYD